MMLRSRLIGLVIKLAGVRGPRAWMIVGGIGGGLIAVVVGSDPLQHPFNLPVGVAIGAGLALLGYWEEKRRSRREGLDGDAGWWFVSHRGWDLILATLSSMLCAVLAGLLFAGGDYFVASVLAFLAAVSIWLGYEALRNRPPMD